MSLATKYVNVVVDNKWHFDLTSFAYVECMIEINCGAIYFDAIQHLSLLMPSKAYLIDKGIIHCMLCFSYYSQLCEIE